MGLGVGSAIRSSLSGRSWELVVTGLWDWRLRSSSALDRRPSPHRIRDTLDAMVNAVKGRDSANSIGSCPAAGSAIVSAAAATHARRRPDRGAAGRGAADLPGVRRVLQYDRAAVLRQPYELRRELLAALGRG